MAFLPEELIWEILTWLPVKTLMRFKTVSKLWLSTILDPAFAQAHRGPVRGLLVIGDTDDLSPVDTFTELMHNLPDASLDDAYCMVDSLPQLTRNLFYVNLDGSDSRSSVDVSIQFPVPKDLCSFKTTNLMNGLLCFYKRKIAVLCNIATRERMRLPATAERYHGSSADYSYHLGFDPINKLYKLIRLIHGGIYEFECEILTIGVDSSWRSIDPTTSELKSSSILRTFYANGEAYWKVLHQVSHQITEVLCISFDLATEKFKRMSEWLEPYMLQSDENSSVSHDPVGGFCDTIADVLDLHEDYLHLFSKPTGFLPYRMQYVYKYIYTLGLNSEPFVYLFDQIKRNMKKIELRNLSGVPFGEGKALGWYKENVISLRQLTACRPF